MEGAYRPRGYVERWEAWQRALRPPAHTMGADAPPRSSSKVFTAPRIRVRLAHKASHGVLYAVASRQQIYAGCDTSLKRGGFLLSSSSVTPIPGRRAAARVIPRACQHKLSHFALYQANGIPQRRAQKSTVLSGLRRHNISESGMGHSRYVGSPHSVPRIWAEGCRYRGAGFLCTHTTRGTVPKDASDDGGVPASPGAICAQRGGLWHPRPAGTQVWTAINNRAYGGSMQELTADARLVRKKPLGTETSPCSRGLV